MTRAELEADLESTYYGAYVSITKPDNSIWYGRVSSVSVWKDEVIFIVDSKRHVLDLEDFREHITILAPKV